MPQTAENTDRHLDSLEQVFDYLSSSETPDLAGGRQQHEAGELLYQEGQLDYRIYRLEDGLLVQSTTSGSDKLAYNFVEPQELCSTYQLSKDAVKQPCETRALLDSSVKYASRPAFKEVMSENPDLYLTMIDSLTDELQQRDQFLEQQITDSARAKVMVILNKLARLAPAVEADGGRKIDFVRQYELAEMTGLSQATVSRKLKYWEEKGRIERCGSSSDRFALLVKDV